MNKIVLTTCSLNHLAQAKGLGDSLIKFNPDYKLVIGLVDKLEDRVPAEYYYPHQIIEASQLPLPAFDEMSRRYNVLELNCAMKSFFTSHVLATFSPEKFIFLDSDIMVFDSLKYVEEELDRNSILLTPHISTPYALDGKRPTEREILKTGLYNAGFFALKNNELAENFLNWWTARMVDQCYEKPCEGMNVDQNWLNLVPLFFDGVKILDHPGCNVAYWNLHERTISKKGEKYFVNEQYPLLFFHFSGYSLKYPQQISRHQDRFNLENESAVQELVQLYHNTLIENKHQELLTLQNVYGKQSFKKRIKKFFKGK